MQKSNTIPVFKIFITGILLFISVVSFSQNKSYWEVNGNIGSSLFYGDVKRYQWAPAKEEWRFGGGVQFGRQFSYVFGLRGQFLYGKLKGVRKEWNTYFTSDYIETNVNATMNLNNLFGRNKRSDRFFNVYLLAGIGLTQYNSTVYELSTDNIIAKVGHGNGKGIGGRTLEGILTGGLGIDFRINDNFRINLETANRAMNSDFMDHWENGFRYDVYNYTSIGISWRFGFKKNKNIGTTEYNSYDSENKQPVEFEKEEGGHVSFDAINIETEKHPVMPPTQDTVTIQDTIINEQPIEEITLIPIEDTIHDTTKITKPEIKEEYRIQIAAKYGNPIPKVILSNKYDIPVDEIEESYYNGYYIYTVGSYKTYEEAKEARKRVIYENGVKGAFIVGFENNKRVDVRELLHKTYYKGLEYRVQISARYNRPISKVKLSNKFNIPINEIKEDVYNGFYIYTVGSFPTYKQAKDYKYTLIDNNGISGAFVVAFSNGKRLPSIPLDHE